MKKQLIIATLLVGVLVVSGFNQSVVKAIDPPNMIEGTITKEGNPIGDAEVLVEYQGGSTKVFTNSSGHYSAPITSPPPVGSQISITARKGNYTGKITIIFTFGKIIIHITIIKTTPVPEFGLLGTIVAAGLGSGTLICIRRHKALVV